MRYIFLTIFLFFIVASNAQNDTLDIEEDNYLTKIIDLPEVYVFDKARTFSSEEERKKYLILQYRVKKVYPYAKLAAERLRIMERTMDTMKQTPKKNLHQTYATLC